MPKLTDAHRGPLTPQSAQKRFSVSFNCLRRRFKLESQSSLLVGGLAEGKRCHVYSVQSRVRTCLAVVCNDRLVLSLPRRSQSSSAVAIGGLVRSSAVVPSRDDDEGRRIISNHILNQMPI